MTYSLTFDLPGLPPTTNAPARTRSGKVTRNFHAINNERAKWKHLVHLASCGQLPPEPLTKARLKLTRFSSASLDYDGLVSSFKAIIDGLVCARILEDDNYDVIGVPDCRWEKTKPKQGFVRVEVYEIPS